MSLKSKKSAKNLRKKSGKKMRRPSKKVKKSLRLKVQKKGGMMEKDLLDQDNKELFARHFLYASFTGISKSGGLIYDFDTNGPYQPATPTIDSGNTKSSYIPFDN